MTSIQKCFAPSPSDYLPRPQMINRGFSIFGKKSLCGDEVFQNTGDDSCPVITSRPPHRPTVECEGRTYHLSRLGFLALRYYVAPDRVQQSPEGANPVVLSQRIHVVLHYSVQHARCL
ncbi:hypothetical protein E2C01_000472 [Portunus trituberculatus]|uniref:Uncharacterized protein n=1 Tax=Portunus trituberculatus TaxID=210409 RepID=A0A5B7CGP1_PORTR|nr:hypothetical protein [Portunus trituberculatus]